MCTYSKFIMNSHVYIFGPFRQSDKFVQIQLELPKWSMLYWNLWQRCGTGLPSAMHRKPWVPWDPK